MAAEERYATKWHGLFPRLVLAGLVFAFAGELLQKIMSALLPLTVQNASSVFSRFEIQEGILVAFFPFAVFALFYLSSRIRINLATDYAAVAASLFLGTLVVFLLFGLQEAMTAGQAELGANSFDALVQSSASAVTGSINYTFVGFAAVLLSYWRRMWWSQRLTRRPRGTRTRTWME